MVRHPESASIFTRGRAAIAMVVVVAIAAGLWWRTRTVEEARDPSRVGPERWVTLDEVRFDKAGRRLVGMGRTNLPDGARVKVQVATTEVVLETEVACASGRFEASESRAGLVTNGAYRAFVTFAIEAQPLALREAMAYQPKKLHAAGKLTIEDATGLEAGPKAELKALFADTLRAGTKEELGVVAARVTAFGRGLWISTLVPSARRLERAIAAGLEGGPLDKEQLRRGVIEAEVLASLP